MNKKIKQFIYFNQIVVKKLFLDETELIENESTCLLNGKGL